MNEIGGESPYLSFGKGGYHRDPEGVARMIMEFSSTDNQLFLLAWLETTLIGALTLEASQRSRIRHRAELSITVSREFWSRGVAGLLISDCLEFVKGGRRIKKIELQVREDNERALRLYRRFGFEVEGILSRAIFTEGKFYAVQLMGLQILE